MADKALLVIDMLNDFVNEKGALYCGETSRNIIPFIKTKIDEFRKETPIIYIMDAHIPDDPEFKLFAKHCVKGTEGAKVIEELKPQKEDILIYKRTYDGMYNSDLELELKRNKIKETYLVGVCTSICVMETASSLTKKGYKVFIYEDGVADSNQETHKFALKRMKILYGAKII